MNTQAQLEIVRGLRRDAEISNELLSRGTYVTTRSATIAGRAYRRGEKVRVKDLSPEKLAQLVNQRILQVAAESLPEMVATRSFVFKGRKFAFGDRFPLQGVSSAKREQLLDHRFISPAIPEGIDVTP